MRGGGPIVSPRLDALLLTPIAAHMVFNRSLVLHPDEVVNLEVLPDNPVIVSVDGRAARQLPPGAVVEVRRGRHDALLVRIGRADFYGRVRALRHLTLGTAPGSGWASQARIAGDVSRASHPRPRGHR